MGWNPCTDELLARAARAIAHTHELIERGRLLQLEGQAHLTVSRMAIAHSQHLLERQASNADRNVAAARVNSADRLASNCNRVKLAGQPVHAAIR
jgi:hypothetical protein